MSIKIRLTLLPILFTNLLANEIDDSFFTQTVTITASPIKERGSFESPSQSEGVSKLEKTLKSTNSLGKLLDDIVGVNNISTGTQAGKPVIRGMSGERVKVLSNFSVMDYQGYGNRHIVNSDLFLADSIEVVRGSQSVLFGSDALGGVVNIISPSVIATTPGKTIIKGELVGEYSTNNKEMMSGIKSQIASGKLGVNIGLSKREADNFHTPKASTYSSGTKVTHLPRFSGELPYTNFKNESANFAIGYTNDFGKTTLSHTYWQSYQNYLGHTATTPYSAVSSAGQKLTNNETQLKGSYFAWDWELKPSYAKTKNDREAATNTPYENMNSKKGTADYLDISIDRDDFKLAVSHPKTGLFKGEIGVEGYNKTQTLKEGAMTPSADESGKSIYIFEEADFRKYIAQAGLRYESRNIKAPLDGKNITFVTNGIFNSTNNNQDFSALVGSFGGTYKINDNFALSSNLSRGFRAPSIFELFAGGIHGGVQAYQIGNPNLKTETSTGIDLSLKHKNKDTKSSITLYHTRISDYIYLANTGFYRASATGVQYTSAGAGRIIEMKNEQTDATMQGAEFAFDTKISSNTRANGSLELIKGYDTKNHKRLSLTPPANAKFAIHQEIPNWFIFKKNSISLDSKYIAAQTISSDKEPFAQYNNIPFGSADTKAYTLFGAGYKSSFLLDSNEATLGIKVTNLFDKEYSDYLDTYKGYALGIGRNITFTLHIPFGK